MLQFVFSTQRVAVGKGVAMWLDVFYSSVSSLLRGNIRRTDRKTVRVYKKHCKEFYTCLHRLILIIGTQTIFFLSSYSLHDKCFFFLVEKERKSGRAEQ